MTERHRAVTADESAAILRLHHAEQWPVGTIATQMGRHHDTVERVLTHSGLPVTKPSSRPRMVDPYLPFIQETLAKYPRLRASLLWAVEERVAVATEERVRVIDPEAPQGVLAEHPRSFDRDQRVAEAGHVRALVEEKRRAHQSRGFDRLFAAVPSSRAMIEKLAQRGENLGGATSGLLQLVDRVGAALVERAVAEVVLRDRLGLRDVHHEIDRLRYEAGLPPPLTVPVTSDVRARTSVRTHALATYDRPQHPKGECPMTTPSSDRLAAELAQLRLYGSLARVDEIRGEAWLERVMAIEREERTRRSLVHRSHLAGVGAFKPVCDFDWAWPKSIDRAQVEDLFTLRFIAEGENVVLIGPNGVGKTMLLRNIAHRALHDGRAVVPISKAPSLSRDDSSLSSSGPEECPSPADSMLASTCGSGNRIGSWRPGRALPRGGELQRGHQATLDVRLVLADVANQLTRVEAPGAQLRHLVGRQHHALEVHGDAAADALERDLASLIVLVDDDAPFGQEGFALDQGAHSLS